MALAIAPFVERNIPDFVQDEYPKFQAFIEAYYEWMDRKGGPSEMLSNLTDYRSVDNTVDEFLEYFRSEFLVTIPTTVLADKRLLVKHIKDFYRAKGTEKSYKFLFRILFNEDVEFFYPKLNVIRASDGKWQEDTAIKLSFTGNTVDVDSLKSKKLVGVTSGASAIIENAFQSSQGNLPYLELYISGLLGTFTDDETINILQSGSEEVILSEKLLRLVSGVNITSGGSGYSKEEPVYVRKPDGTQVGNGRVISISTGRVESFTVTAGGGLYKGRRQTIFDFENLQVGETVEGSNLQYTTIASVANYTISRHSVGGWLTRENGTPDTIIFTDVLGSNGAGAKGEVARTDDYGVILQATLTSKGNSLYNTPVYSFVSQNGTGAQLEVVGGGGSVKSVRLDTFPIDTGDLSVDFTYSGDRNATGTLTYANVVKYPGRWIGTDSLLSSEQKIHDGKYYQDFSYELRSKLQVSQWHDIIKNVVHPAGLALFGAAVTTDDLTDDESLVVKSAYESRVIDIVDRLSTAIANKYDYVIKTIRENVNVAISSLSYRTFQYWDATKNVASSSASETRKVGIGSQGDVAVANSKETRQVGARTKELVVSSVALSPNTVGIRSQANLGLLSQSNATMITEDGEFSYTGTLANLENYYVAKTPISGFQTNTLNDTKPSVRVTHSELRVDLAHEYGTKSGTAAGTPLLNEDYVYNPVLNSGITFSRASIGTYYNSAGILTTAAANQPRFNYDPITKVCKGLLIEEQRTNRVGYSTYKAPAGGSYDANGWNNIFGGIQITTGIAAPDGTNTAVRLKSTGATTELMRIGIPSFTTTGTSLTLSFYVRQIVAPSTALWCDMMDAQPGGAFSTVLVQNQWVRYVTTATVAAGSTYGFIDLISDGKASYELDFWGLQVEEGAFATSYIPTNGTTVTRQADDVSMLTANITGFNSGGYTVMVDTEAGNGTEPMMLTLYDNTWNNITRISRTLNTQLRVLNYTAGVSDADVWSSALTATGTNRVAISKGTDLVVYGNGTTVSSDPACGATPYTRIKLGADPTAYLNGHFRRLKLFGTRLTDTQLQAITS